MSAANSVRVNATGAILHAESDGSAASEALLLWPPGSCTVRVWDHLVPVLVERFRVVRFDIRGLGKSSPADDVQAQYTLEQYADDACRVLDHFGIARCHVWSQSWGTRAAIAFCALHPKRVVSAALFAANMDAPDVEAQREGSKRAARIQRQAGYRPPPLPAGWRDHETPEAAGPAMSAWRKFDLAAAVEKLTMPVLIGTGDHDPNLASSRDVAAAAPNARIEVLENVGHNAILEQPDVALRTFLDFHDSLAAGHPAADGS